MKNPTVINYPGSKNESHFHTAFEHMFKVVSEDYKIFETCIGGNGIQPYSFTDKRYKEYIISDYDMNILNIYLYIRNSPFGLLNTCKELCCKIKQEFNSKILLNSENFDVISKFIKNHLKFQDVVLQNVILTMFEKACPFQNKNNLSLEKHLKHFQANYSNIPDLHKQLHNATILNKLPDAQRNLHALLKNHHKKKDIFWLIDPPYYLTDKFYDSNSPNYCFHENLAKQLNKTKGKFCLFLRINASRANNSKDNEAIDYALFNFYDTFYSDKKYYVYCDDFQNKKYFINYRGNGTLEAMITNFSYTNAYPLDEVFQNYWNEVLDA